MLIPALFLVGFFFSQLGVLVGVRAEQFDDVSFAQTFILTPLIFLGGVFYSASLLTEPFQTLTHFNPIYYMINLVRYGFLGYTEANVGAVAGRPHARHRRPVRREPAAVPDRVQAARVTDFLVSRKDIRETRIEDSEPPALEPGQALLEVDSFGLTANNVTYAVFGDVMNYWDFFPAEDGWGRVPMWGFAEVEASEADGLEAGRARVRLPAAVVAPGRDAGRRRPRVRGRGAAPQGRSRPPTSATRRSAPTPSTARTPRRCRCSCARCSSPRS